MSKKVASYLCVNHDIESSNEQHLFETEIGQGMTLLAYFSILAEEKYSFLSKLPPIFWTVSIFCFKCACSVFLMFKCGLSVLKHFAITV